MTPRQLLLAVLLALPLSAQQPDLYEETVLRSLELTFHQVNWWQQLVNNYTTETDIPADLTVDGVTYANVGVRFKGNSSYTATGSSQKKSFNVTMDAFVAGQELYGHDNLNLNNGFLDPTFVREVLTLHVMRNYIPAPKANWVVLRINGQNWGVYVNVQQVDKSFMDGWLRSDDGNRYKADAFGGGSSALTWLGSSASAYQPYYELKTTSNPIIWTDLINVCDALNNSPAQNLEANLQPLFGVDRALWMLALNNVFGNLDSYIGPGHNYWILADDFHGRLQTIPWDVNESFGTFQMGMPNPYAILTMSPLYGSTDYQRPLMAKLVGQNATLRQVYLAHMRTVLDEWFDWSILSPMIATYQALIDAEVQADTKKLYSYAQFLQCVTQTQVLNFGGPGGRTVHGLMPFVNTRRNYLATHSEVNRPVPTIAAPNLSPAAPTSDDTVTVSAQVTGTSSGVSSVVCHHRAQGMFVQAPMFDDGQHGDGAPGDGLWGVFIAPQPAGAHVEYYLAATASASQGGAVALSPRASEHAPHFYDVLPGSLPPSVRINEFVAKNANGIVDEAGEHEDWLEIVNLTGAPVDLSGMYLTDELADPTEWQIPSGTVLQDGATVLIWADDDLLDGPLHASFKLSASGEELALFDTDGTTLLDAIVFGPQVEDLSTGRIFDGDPRLVTFPAPTPDALNAPGTCGLRSYSALDPVAQDLDFRIVGSATLGAPITLQVRMGLPNQLHWILLSGLPGHHAVPGTDAVLLLDLGFEPFLVASSNALGELDIPLTIPSAPWLAGLSTYLQCATLDSASVIHGSQAIEVTFCP